MEIEVTNMVNDSDYMPYLSGSVAELGDRAGALTWENSQRYAERSPLLKPEQCEDVREYFASMGFGDEARAWSDAETQAAMIQDVASAIREMEDYSSYESYTKAQESGQVSSSLFQSSDNRWFYYVGY